MIIYVVLHQGFAKGFGSCLSQCDFARTNRSDVMTMDMRKQAARSCWSKLPPVHETRHEGKWPALFLNALVLVFKTSVPSVIKLGGAGGTGSGPTRAPGQPQRHHVLGPRDIGHDCAVDCMRASQWHRTGGTFIPLHSQGSDESMNVIVQLGTTVVASAASPSPSVAFARMQQPHAMQKVAVVTVPKPCTVMEPLVQAIKTEEVQVEEKLDVKVKVEELQHQEDVKPAYHSPLDHATTKEQRLEILKLILQDHNYVAPPVAEITASTHGPSIAASSYSGTGTMYPYGELEHGVFLCRGRGGNNEDDDANSVISSGTGREVEPEGEETETAPEGEGDDDDSVTRCICVWQHVDCMQIDRANIPELYSCERCQPRKVDKQRARALQLRKREELFHVDSSTDSSSSSSPDCATCMPAPTLGWLGLAVGIAVKGWLLAELVGPQMLPQLELLEVIRAGVTVAAGPTQSCAVTPSGNTKCVVFGFFQSLSYVTVGHEVGQAEQNQSHTPSNLRGAVDGVQTDLVSPPLGLFDEWLELVCLMKLPVAYRCCCHLMPPVADRCCCHLKPPVADRCCCHLKSLVTTMVETTGGLSKTVVIAGSSCWGLLQTYGSLESPALSARVRSSSSTSGKKRVSAVPPPAAASTRRKSEPAPSSSSTKSSGKKPATSKQPPAPLPPPPPLRQRRESTTKEQRKAPPVTRRKESKRMPVRRKSKSRTVVSDSDEDSDVEKPSSVQELRQWIEHYEEAVTNHYSPELRARISSIKVNGIHSDLRVGSLPVTPKCRTTILGSGLRILYAAVHLPPNQPVIELRGKYMLSIQHHASVSMQNSRRVRLPPGPYIFFYRLPKDGTEVCVDTSTYGNDARFVRRSCKPNAEMRHCIEKGTLHLYLVTLCKVERGAEITIAHDSSQENLTPVSCACGNPDECSAFSRKNGLHEQISDRERRRRVRRSSTNDGDGQVNQPPAPAPTSPNKPSAPVTRRSSAVRSPVKQAPPPRPATPPAEEATSPVVTNERSHQAKADTAPMSSVAATTVAATVTTTTATTTATAATNPTSTAAVAVVTVSERKAAASSSVATSSSSSCTSTNTTTAYTTAVATTTTTTTTTSVSTTTTATTTTIATTTAVTVSPSATTPVEESNRKLVRHNYLSREDRKMAAILKAIERMEQQSQKRECGQTKQTQRKEAEPVVKKPEPKPEVKPDPPKKECKKTTVERPRRKRRRGRTRTNSTSTRRSRRDSVDSEASSGDEGPQGPLNSSPGDSQEMSESPGHGLSTAAGLLLALANATTPQQNPPSSYRPHTPPSLDKSTKFCCTCILMFTGCVYYKPTNYLFCVQLNSETLGGVNPTMFSSVCDSGGGSSSQGSTPPTPLSSACLLVAAAVDNLAPGFKFPKTKKVRLVHLVSPLYAFQALMNEWLNQPSTPPEVMADSALALSHNKCLVQGQGASHAKAGSGSAKKRWLRQAISEEGEVGGSPNSRAGMFFLPVPCILKSGNCTLKTSGNSIENLVSTQQLNCACVCVCTGADSPPGLDCVPPLKKRRLARESMSSEQSVTPPSTPTQNADSFPLKEGGTVTTAASLPTDFCGFPTAGALSSAGGEEQRSDKPRVRLGNFELIEPRSVHLELQLRSELSSPLLGEKPDQHNTQDDSINSDVNAATGGNLDIESDVQCSRANCTGSGTLRQECTICGKPYIMPAWAGQKRFMIQED
ncbi:hypothetical protein PR048_032597 [Dryococelus australis]|uniref:SET domain-containing protein n=1 Tax=Dryococelus australis TaxID=614101 RepID=A0ABQ9G2M6_9NEOP|nr:hypothetical protein PR048_032597 [Dryococelus australis]